MAISITHTTPADSSFSAAGKAAWEETHTTSIDHNDLDNMDGGAPEGGYYHLTRAEYDWVYGQLPENAREITGTTGTPLTRTTDTGNPAGIPDYTCLLYFPPATLPWYDGGTGLYDTSRVIAINAAGFNNADVIRILISAGYINILRNTDQNPFHNATQLPDFADLDSFYAYVASNSTVVFWAYVNGDGNGDALCNMGTGDGVSSPDYFEITVINNNFYVSSQNFLNWMQGQVAWSKIDKTASSIDDLADVDVASKNDGDVLTWDETSGTWIAAAGGGGGASDWGDIGGTLSNQTDLQAALDSKEDHHGIETTGTLSFNNTSHVVTLASGTNTYWYKGTKYTTANAITCDLDDYITLTTNTLYYVYFDDATGTLKASASAWDLYEKVPVCTVYWNGTAGAAVNERHRYNYRPIGWHVNAHKTIGARLESTSDFALTTTGNGSIAGGVLWDEDIANTLSTATTCRRWYQASATKYTWDDQSTIFPTTQAQFVDSSNSYTITSVGQNKYCNIWYYASPDIDRGIYRVMETIAGGTGYSTVAAARAINAPGVGSITNELKLLYRVIFQQGVGSVSYVETTDYRSTTSLPGGATVSPTAAGTTFAPAGNIAATTVQTAIEELDTEKLPVTVTTKGDLITYGTAPTRLAVGATNGHVLTVDSNEATGLKWAAASGSVSDTAYGASWDGVTDVAPSKNAVYDKINSMSSGVTVSQSTTTLAQNASTNITATTVTSVYERSIYDAVSPTFLLHGDGANNGTTITDSSSGNKTPTNTSVVTSTAQYKFGTASLYFNGSANLAYADHADFGFGTGDFCVDAWIYGATNDAVLFDFRSTGADKHVIYVSSAGNLQWFDGSTVYEGTISITGNSWKHVALTRSSGTMRMFVNGTKCKEQANSTDLQSSRTLKIGARYDDGVYFTGYVDEFRIVKGSAIYTADFTAPVFPYGTQVILKPGTDYEASRTGTGSQTITMTRLKAGTAIMTTDYL